MHPNTAALLDEWSNCSRNANVTCQWLLSCIIGFISIILVSVCARAHDLPNINCFLAENLRENHEMLDHLHSKGSQEFWDQWFWSLIFEDFSRVHPLSHRSQTQLLLKNIAIVARVLWVSHIPPSSMGMGQAERCTILLSISTYWCIPFLSGYLGNRMKLSIQQRAKIACHSWAQWPLVNQLSTPVITWHSFCCHMVQVKEHSICWILLDIQLLFVTPDFYRWIWIHFVGLSPQEHKLRPVLHSLKRHALQ